MLGLLYKSIEADLDGPLYSIHLHDPIAEIHELVTNTNLLGIGDDGALDDRRKSTRFAFQLLDNPIT